mgnify:FL=1
MEIREIKDDPVIRQVMQLAGNYGFRKIVLFGSRARGDHSSVSDYDFAFYGDNVSELDKSCFSVEVDDVSTLKKIDIVFIDHLTPAELLNNISSEGVILYE